MSKRRPLPHFERTVSAAQGVAVQRLSPLIQDDTELLLGVWDAVAEAVRQYDEATHRANPELRKSGEATNTIAHDAINSVLRLINAELANSWRYNPEHLRGYDVADSKRQWRRDVETAKNVLGVLYEATLHRHGLLSDASGRPSTSNDPAFEGLCGALLKVYAAAAGVPLSKVGISGSQARADRSRRVPTAVQFIEAVSAEVVGTGDIRRVERAARRAKSQH